MAVMKHVRYDLVKLNQDGCAAGLPSFFMFPRFVLFRGGTLSPSVCVAACTTDQVLGYKLQLYRALETSEAKHHCLVLHE